VDRIFGNIENFTALTEPQYQITLCVLMVGYGAHLAFSAFFLAGTVTTAPRYRLVPIMSAVVMLAAGLSLLRLWSSFAENYMFDTALWQPIATEMHSNAYRYANWIITIPLLLAQLLIAMRLTASEFASRFWKLVVAAELMIITGLIGQFYEHASVGTMLIWGFVSTIPFVYLVFGVRKVLNIGSNRMEGSLSALPKKLFFYFLFFWGLYAIAYMVPAFADGGGAVMVRQILYTIADVFSKLVYGLILMRLVLRLSAEEGYGDALKSLLPGEGGSGHRAEGEAAASPQPSATPR
jgi:bacteriorhodopsin